MGLGNSREYNDCKGKVIMVTGGTAGIGKECVRKYVELGASVVFTGRSQKSANDVIEELSKSYPDSPKPVFLPCDVEDLSSVKSVAEQFSKKHEKLDVLLNNVGALVSNYHKTKDNFEATFQLNHLSGFYLTSLLFDKLKNTENSRVINVSSRAHTRVAAIDLDDIKHEKVTEENYSVWTEYSYGKLLNVLFTKGLNRIIIKENLKMKTASLHPGVIKSNFWGNLPNWQKAIMYSVYPLVWLATFNTVRGADCNLYTSLCPFEELDSGAYFNDDCTKTEPIALANDQENITKAWNASKDYLEQH